MLRLLTTALRRIALACTAVDLAALAAHALELPNKLALSGPLWLAVQQQLYRGWGPVLGPFEVGAVAATCVIAARAPGHATAIAALCLVVSFAAFFALVQPVNVAVAGWTPVTLPSDWARYRLRWELGHLLRFVLAAIALACLVAAGRVERVQR